MIEKLSDWFGDSALNHKINTFASWLIIALAATLRLVGLNYPSKLVFDETYYVKDAYTLLRTGAEKSWPNNPNPAFESGLVDSYLNNPSFVVHPPLGKWIISIGMWAFDAKNPFSWRISVALIGIATVALLIVTAKLILKSHTWANVAGFLMAIEGGAIVMSRTGLLDSILGFFALAAFFALAKDAQTRNLQIETFNRPWLWLMALMLGAATAVKWSGLYFAMAFGLYLVVSESLSRRRIQQENWAVRGFALQGLRSFLIVAPTVLITYVTSWLGWFATSGGYDRDWADQAANRWTGFFAWVPSSLQSWIHYHQEILGFHVNLKTPHSYQANPLTWLFNVRPTSFFYEGLKNGEGGCTDPSGCSSAITALAHPLIWLSATAALFVLLYFVFRNHDRTAGLILIGMAGGYLPWLAIMGRTVFQFYAVAFTPWMMLALAYVLRRYVDSAGPDKRGRQIWIMLSFLAASAAITIYFLPVWLGTWVPYWFWHAHMWLPSWI